MATPDEANDNENDNPLHGIVGHQPTTHPLVLPKKFDGTGNFKEWISHFESVAAINKWNEEEKGLWIRVRLTEKAHMSLTLLTSDTPQMYEALKRALRERFEPSSKQEVYKAEFENQRK